ncbi:hypothetical protein FHS43_002537 [Streptosporangium becharense]|uniref:Lipoprotein n=1 Tax=Streptosporangium becharense TaxID=1816182 RepID=A0A7W9IJ59_9ACTN|nr:hypothetical protein [Streptosporangium becharense]MBB2911272.1 hypothetical protein [Streptosporangium becharense]MBB5821670.1 hypothetical protein [Streptosporangium becharense]
MACSARRGVAVCAAVLLAVSGCADSGPTAAEAGETLKTHITELMKEGHVLDVRITDSGGRDIPCGEGKAKRTFAAAGRDSAERSDPDGLNTYLIGVLSSVAPYRIVEDRGNAPIRLANGEYKTVIILESPAEGQYAVRGETECLPVS